MVMDTFKNLTGIIMESNMETQDFTNGRFPSSICLYKQSQESETKRWQGFKPMQETVTCYQYTQRVLQRRYRDVHYLSED